MKVSVRIPNELYTDIAEFAEAEDRTFSKALSILASIGLKRVNEAIARADKVSRRVLNS